MSPNYFLNFLPLRLMLRSIGVSSDNLEYRNLP